MESSTIGTAGQLITLSFLNGQEITIRNEEGALSFAPDARTCVLYLFDYMLFHRHGICAMCDNGSITVGNFRIDFCKSDRQFTVQWEGKDPPASFIEFEKEWNRFLNLKAFW